MADFRRYLTNESTPQGGNKFEDIDINFGPFAQANSAHGRSAAHVPIFTMPSDQSGKVLDFWIGVGLPAVSASGFITGDVTAFPRVNSDAVLSTDPTIVKAGSAGQAARTNTFGGGTTALATSAVVNAASAAVPAGAEITLTYDAKSVGSAAAGAAGVGFYGQMKVRLYAK